MPFFEEIKKSFGLGKVRWRQHALTRMMERNISRQDVQDVIEHGEIIENYPDTKPYPSCLVFGTITGKTLHVVVAFDENSGITYIITAYEPSEKHFFPDLKTRKKGKS